MMFSLSGVCVYLALGFTDMRMSIIVFSALVSERMNLNPLSGHLFVYTNRRKTILKILYWDRNGFCLWRKRLKKESFKWPVSEKEVLSINQRELMWLIDGLDIRHVRAHQTLTYSKACY